MPPFQPKHTDLEALEIVRAVSLVADPDSPTTVSQTAWDESRSKAGHSDAPAARSFCDRWGVSWPRVLRIAHGSLDDALRALGNAAADKGRKGVTLPRIATALSQVAAKLERPGINRTEYRRGRDLIIQASRGPARQAALRALPELTQIETVLKQNEMSWEDGQTLAGLVIPPHSHGAGVAISDAVGQFVRAQGKLPRTRYQVRSWCKAHRVSLARATQEDFDAAVEAIRAERAANGEPPLVVAARSEDLAPSAGASVADGPPPRAEEWTEKEPVIRGMAVAVRLLRGKQLTQRRLKDMARDHRGLGIPTSSSVNRCREKYYPGETWREWVTEATTLAKSDATL